MIRDVKMMIKIILKIAKVTISADRFYSNGFVKEYGQKKSLKKLILVIFLLSMKFKRLLYFLNYIKVFLTLNLISSSKKRLASILQVMQLVQSILL